MAYQNLLLIDDDEDDRGIFTDAVKEVSESVICHTLSSAREALKKLLAKDLKPHVIFLDLNMPVMNGQQFLIEIKKHVELKNIPVIILSTTSNSATIKLTKELGAHDFISKPGRFNELVHILTSILI